MNYKTALAAAASFALLASPLFASAAIYGSAGLGASATVGSTTVGAKAEANMEARITKGKDRADQELKRRITALTDLSTRVNAMVRLSADEKASLTASIQSQITTLTDLDAKIQADTDLATLKTDIQSITKSYRIFMLVMPQGRITAAADRIQTAATNLTALAGKLQTRISGATGDTSALVTALADMNAKIADANTQASAAITEVASLKPDNGDQSVMQSNNAALKDARGKIEAAMKDLVTARQDAHTIVKGLKALGDASASTNTSASGGTAQ